MKKLTLLLLLAAGSFTMAQDKSIDLKNKILQKFNEIPGTFALAFRDVQTGESLFVNEKEIFHAASTMKTPVMIEVFKQAEEGKFKLDDSIIVENDFISIVDSSHYSMDLTDDSGEELYSFIGKNKTIRELVYNMITVSSNMATNILIEVVDAKNVMETMKEIGANDIQVLRGVEDNKAFQAGLNNTTTAYDLMLIFEKIASKEIVSESACNEMIEILFDQKLREKIPSKLPAEVKVANKTGSITGVQHDSGIIYLPDGRKYILVLLAKDLKDAEAGIEVESEVSRMIYDFVK